MRMAGMSVEQARAKMEKDPNTVIMEPTYDNVFEPWTSNSVIDCVNKIANISRQNLDVQKEVDANPTLKEFARLHPKIFERISNPEITQNEAFMQTIYHMINMQSKVRNGEISDVDARASVSDKALAAVMQCSSASETNTN